LAGAPGPRLLDVGGGTGNYAAALRQAGWEPTVVDVSERMLAHAAGKGLPTVVGDAAALPFRAESFDAVMLVSMIHHVGEQAAALTEARRVLVPGGRLALMGWTREHIEQVTWVSRYFPSMGPAIGAFHEPLNFYLRALPGARVIPVVFTDCVDLSLAALQRWPELILRAELRAQTSYFERLGDTWPDELETGVARLRDDLAAGRNPDEEPAVREARSRLGDACVLAWAKPG
jgi:demethylmenaquinone methyltransferase/2-methoxy-6-polyprenyl-1,4-benzoquinol methylase